MDQERLQRYLHEQIPLSAAMKVSVRSATRESVVLAAPLAPNINHKRTVFGGSASALGILAAWSLVHLRLVEEGCDCEVVIQSGEMDYDRPMGGSFTAASALADAAGWPMFVKTLMRKGRARIEVCSELREDDAMACRFRGRFVAFRRDVPEVR